MDLSQFTAGIITIFFREQHYLCLNRRYVFQNRIRESLRFGLSKSLLPLETSVKRCFTPSELSRSKVFMYAVFTTESDFSVLFSEEPIASVINTSLERGKTVSRPIRCSTTVSPVVWYLWMFIVDDRFSRCCADVILFRYVKLNRKGFALPHLRNDESFLGTSRGGVNAGYSR